MARLSPIGAKATSESAMVELAEILDVSLMLLDDAGMLLVSTDESEDPQAANEDAVSAVASIRVTIFFCIDILLFENVFCAGYNIPYIRLAIQKITD